MKLKIPVFLITISLINVGCFNSKENSRKHENSSQKEVKDISFSSSDKNLEETFLWAKSMALSYAHDGTDPVGYWYEAALPGRQAFCMRDMAHQSIGAEIIGLKAHNENMLTKFVENISAGKDWCSFWEINSDDKPAPVDYTDDDHFWYNLNANFDILQACLKVYEWTGNDKLLKDDRFINFYKITLNEYVEKWQLEPERIMARSQYLNVKDRESNSHASTRGLPSYVENYPNLTVSSDLIASIYAGFAAYSKIAELNNAAEESAKYKAIAQQYRNLLENTWWDAKLNSYHTFWTSENEFANGEGLTFILWFDGTDNPDRIRATVEKIMSKKDWNIENQSYFPVIYYSLNYLPEAYKQLIDLRTVERCEYPEVSYGALEGVICGTMGIKPAFSERQVTTMARFTKDKENTWAEVENLPLFGGYISVRHENNHSGYLINNTGEPLMWQASFMGEYSKIEINGKIYDASVGYDSLGNRISYVNIEVPNDEKTVVKAVA